MSDVPTKSLEWQRQEMTARRQRGQSQHPVSVFQAEDFILRQARKLTGVSQGDFIRLALLDREFCLASLESDIVRLAYAKEEAEKTSLRAVEDVEKDIAIFADSIHARLITVEEQVRAYWSPLGGN